MKDERRKTIRISKPLVVEYSKDSKAWDISHIKDFSETGMQITTATNLTAGEILRLRTKIPLEPFEWLEFSGRVISSTELRTPLDFALPDTHVTRIEFVDIKDEQKVLVKKYVEWFLSKKKQ